MNGFPLPFTNPLDLTGAAAGTAGATVPSVGATSAASNRCLGGASMGGFDQMGQQAAQQFTLMLTGLFTGLMLGRGSSGKKTGIPALDKALGLTGSKKKPKNKEAKAKNKAHKPKPQPKHKPKPQPQPINIDFNFPGTMQAQPNTNVYNYHFPSYAPPPNIQPFNQTNFVTNIFAQQYL